MFKFFKRSPKESKPIELGVNYFVNGENVLFNLNSLDFTFEKFYVIVTADSLKILVEDEVPMNLMNILGAVKDELDVDRKEILEADTVRFILKLNDETFAEVKSKLLKITEIADIFQLEVNGKLPLKNFKSYVLDLHGTTKEL